MYVLAGDIGGTNTRLIYAEVNKNNRKIICEKSYSSSKYDSLIELVNVFLADNDIASAVNAACFAVAGPVKSGISSITNLPWVINEKELSSFLQTAHVKIINDFVSVSYGIAGLNEDDILILQPGLSDEIKQNNYNAAVIGAGTGLGVSHIVFHNDHQLIFSSEAGHVGFAPENKQQTKLLNWLQEQYSHVSLEMLLSGKGLYVIYQFLHDVMGITETAGINEEMKKSDPAQIITNRALSNNDELCEKTLDCFIDIFGAAAGNIALHYYPTAEIYIAGGIAPKIQDKLLNHRFINSFRDKGVMTLNMKNISVKLVLQEKVGLYGALSHAQTLYN